MSEKSRTAPAKINLTLDILNRRTDGYHDMRMVMQSISLTDVVTLSQQKDGFTLQIEDASFPFDKKSLEQQAAETFFSAIGQPLPSLCVKLKKIVPAYAGLGGGSADVAALLRLLREIYSPSLPIEKLEEIGLMVGSDIPFCIRCGTALAEGRGEHLTDLPPMPDCFIVLCKPNFGIPTPVLFAAADDITLKRRPNTEGMIAALKEKNLQDIAEQLYNVFEEVLQKAMPKEYEEISLIKSRMSALGALNAIMSGSGSTVFGLFADNETAEAAALSLRQDWKNTFLAHPLPKMET